MGVMPAKNSNDGIYKYLHQICQTASSGMRIHSFEKGCYRT